jgi:hypothetical protein
LSFVVDVSSVSLAEVDVERRLETGDMGTRGGVLDKVGGKEGVDGVDEARMFSNGCGRFSDDAFL